MPHLFLEYSANITDDIKAVDCLRSLHSVMSLVTDKHKIKSRVIKHEHFLIGDEEERAFVHLSVLLLAGREEMVKKQLSQDLHSCLKACFPQTYKKNICDFTVSIEDIDPNVYSKESNFKL